MLETGDIIYQSIAPPIPNSVVKRFSRKFTSGFSKSDHFYFVRYLAIVCKLTESGVARNENQSLQSPILKTHLGPSVCMKYIIFLNGDQNFPTNSTY